ncbi:zinc ribbon domain-containing protein [Methanoculleus sp. 7T]|jgi:putative transposase|uniref:zinc ribbon domain-containing protein n=1 Tax=Methanoculleus sp. 7T TaxID=2937282 RepID=UPI0020BEEF13|nr:zinc ribbon domain-containing protein [Methanoculleus sp. 7T]MCK8518815.1 zinc ribbon domain-containing protein [Methanoculleus sp. 7T]
MPFSTDNASSCDWIGVDLNTTGYTAVVAHPASGGVVMLGEREQAEDGCGGASKRKKNRSREQAFRRDQNQRIAKEIVKMARQLECGIKFEDLSGAGFAGRTKQSTPLPFSRREGSFYHLQKLVEARAQSAGVRIVYVNPAFTSQRCSRCGEPGIRKGKRFSCPHCGYVVHADANAAFNIASAPPDAGTWVS